MKVRLWFAALALAGGYGLAAVKDEAPAPAADGYTPPRHYVCCRATGPVTIDGRIDEAAWDAAPWTDDFVDIEGGRKPAPRFRTRAKMLWDDRYFYIAAEMEEPHVWATLTEHDSVIFQDNDFELFIDPDGDNHNYAEFEINALNTGWDLLLDKPYMDGGKADNSWEIPGLKTAVYVDGTLNDGDDRDRGWSVEIALPWDVLGKLSAQPAPPHDGDQWRVNYSRVEWKTSIKKNGLSVKVPGEREDNWVWSPQGVVNMHRPETWGAIQFSTAAPGAEAFRPDPAESAKHQLMRIYYAQHDFHDAHKRYAKTLEELGLGGLKDATLTGPPAVEADDDHFRATAEVKLPGGATRRWNVREDSRLWPDDK